jgi:hypothetical protein
MAIFSGNIGAPTSPAETAATAPSNSRGGLKGWFEGELIGIDTEIVQSEVQEVHWSEQEVHRDWFPVNITNIQRRREGETVQREVSRERSNDGLTHLER